MAGLGRRTHYRKHLTDSILYDLPIPGPSERIAKVASTRGSNQFDVIVAAPTSATSTTNVPADDSKQRPDRLPQLAILPTKFRKLVWIKRNDYVIVDTGSPSTDDETTAADRGGKEESPNNTNEASTNVFDGFSADESGGGIRLIITHILYKEQVKHLKAQGAWPSHDPLFSSDDDPEPIRGVADDDDDGNDDSSTDGDDSNADPGRPYAAGEGEDEDGIVYANDDDDKDDLFINTNRVAALRVDDSSSSSDDDDESAS